MKPITNTLELALFTTVAGLFTMICFLFRMNGIKTLADVRREIERAQKRASDGL